ncbi:MAG: response regulator transcription factor [Ilumatobacteraceae bacterium]|nr:MAG: response regulator transcription factor [Actinomycetota bacterium]
MRRVEWDRLPEHVAQPQGAFAEPVAEHRDVAATGEAVFGPGIADRVLRTFTAPPPTTAVPFPELTDREREVLNQLAAGKSNGEIAQTLLLSPRTVANHVSSILTKLQATDRIQAALRARDAGLGK